MQKTRAYLIALLATVWITNSGFGCGWTPAWSTPARGETTLPVPHYLQLNNYYCGPATVLMWRSLRLGWPGGITQDDIWNWMAARYPTSTSPGLGATDWAIAAAATEFTGQFITSDTYYGFSEIRRAVADQKKGIDNNNPTIVIFNSGFHAVIVIGATWHQLSTAQPHSDFMIYHDPLRSPKSYSTLSNWMNYDARSCFGECMTNLQVSYQRYSGIPALEDFDYWGGTYYGDPNPPDRGPIEARLTPSRLPVPIPQVEEKNRHWVAQAGRALLRTPLGLFWRESSLDDSYNARMAAPLRRGPERAAKPVNEHAPSTRSTTQAEPRRRGTHIPHRYATTRQEILENIAAGVEQTQLNRIAGFEPLGLQDGSLHVRRILDVQSEGLTPDYYLVEFQDRTGGAFANVTISKEGLLLAVEDARGLSLLLPLGQEAVASALWHAVGNVPRTVRYVYAPGDAEPGASPFAPFAVADTDAGFFYLNAAGDVFQETASATDAFLMARGLRKDLRRISR